MRVHSIFPIEKSGNIYKQRESIGRPVATNAPILGFVMSMNTNSFYLYSQIPIASTEKHSCVAGENGEKGVYNSEASLCPPSKSVGTPSGGDIRHLEGGNSGS